MKVVSNVPCYNCQKRTTGCHSDCKDYKEYASKNLEKKSKAEAHWKKDKDFYSYCEDRTKRLKRLKGKH